MQLNKQRILRGKLGTFCAIAMGIISVVLCLILSRDPAPDHLSDLCALAPRSVSRIPLARMNLLCSEGLRSTEPSPREEYLTILQVWAGRVRSETERHLYRFQRNPGEYQNSEAYFRMLMLTVILAEDFGISYNPGKRVTPGESGMNDGFFTDPTQVFLSGLLGPQHQGTCSSMPALYVAIGRELGYPLKLVTTKGHLFVRWDGHGDRFNIEATARGLVTHSDDYYRHWPFEITPEEEKAEGYLKSLTPPDELAVFLSIRGMCLRDQSLYAEAAQAFAAAAQ